MDNGQLLKIILERLDKVDLQFKEVLNRQFDRIEKGQQEGIKRSSSFII
ncbi:hypothetical protein LGQ02_10045 [Bacillus shivajii]|nr:hypothetical protein [Bacillus shivajii]UCZ55034.1 hypothetical protein LGQ02_10045 [Bacillus shivajii]